MPADGTTLPFKKRDLGTSRWQLGLNATPDLKADGRGQPDVLLQSLTAVHGTRVISLLRSNLVASGVKRTYNDKGSSFGTHAAAYRLGNE